MAEKGGHWVKSAGGGMSFVAGGGGNSAGAGDAFKVAATEAGLESQGKDLRLRISKLQDVTDMYSGAAPEARKAAWTQMRVLQDRLEAVRAKSHELTLAADMARAEHNKAYKQGKRW